MTARRSSPPPVPVSGASLVQGDGRAAAGLIAGAGHDLRSPLGALVMNLGLLAEALEELGVAGDERVSAALEDGVASLDAMQQILDAMRVVAPRDMHAEPIGRVLVALERLLRWDLARRGLQLAVRVDTAVSWPAEDIVPAVLVLVHRASSRAARGASIRVSVRIDDGGDLVIEVDGETVRARGTSERAA